MHDEGEGMTTLRSCAACPESKQDTCSTKFKACTAHCALFALVQASAAAALARPGLRHSGSLARFFFPFPSPDQRLSMLGPPACLGETEAASMRQLATMRRTKHWLGDARFQANVHSCSFYHAPESRRRKIASLPSVGPRRGKCWHGPRQRKPPSPGRRPKARRPRHDGPSQSNQSFFFAVLVCPFPCLCFLPGQTRFLDPGAKRGQREARWRLPGDCAFPATGRSSSVNGKSCRCIAPARGHRPSRPLAA